MKKRNGCKDLWNSFMYKDASLINGMCCTKSSNIVPKTLISFEEAVILYRKNIKNKNFDFKEDSYIHFYIDDQKFDENNNIWKSPYWFLEIVKHFAGCILPDYSTYTDLPEYERKRNYGRMFAFGNFLKNENINFIHNLRWNYDSLEYCFSGIEEGSVVCIGTVASKLNIFKNRIDFEIGLYKAIEIIKPKIIIVYGSVNISLFKTLEESGIRIIHFRSKMDEVYRRLKNGKAK